MKQTLVIGSTVVDAYLRVPALPQRGNDINITKSEYRIGGCAYNVFKTLRSFKSPATLCSPVGTGIYGAIVAEHFRAAGITPFVLLEEKNGCCYCLIEPDGERSFLSHHGAEYLFSRSWMNNIDYSTVDSVYICGIEVEDPTGSEIVEFVYEHPELSLYFAPGPRILRIGKDRMEKLLYRRDVHGKGPLIHLSETEMLEFSGYADIGGGASRLEGVMAGAAILAEKTENAVAVTLGEKGCYCLEKPGAEGSLVPGIPVKAVNTVGLGDAHCGALIACLKAGMNLAEACLHANETGAALAAKPAEARG